jgi:hypothetical protein
MACSYCAAARQAVAKNAQAAAAGDLQNARVSAAQVIAEIKAKVAEKLGRNRGD